MNGLFLIQGNEKEMNNMPKIGDKEFPYTPEGIAAAKAESQDKGIPMSNGAQRSVQDYAGSGKTGFAGIGKPLDVMQGIENVGMETEVPNMPELAESLSNVYEEGGKVKKYKK